jgi:hypothetical protein
MATSLQTNLPAFSRVSKGIGQQIVEHARGSRSS